MWFTTGQSSTDRFLALRILVESRLEIRQGLLAAYFDFKKAFDSVYRETLKHFADPWDPWKDF